MCFARLIAIGGSGAADYWLLAIGSKEDDNCAASRYALAGCSAVTITLTPTREERRLPLAPTGGERCLRRLLVYQHNL